MREGVYEINILLGENPFPHPVINEGADNIELPPVDETRLPGVVKTPKHTLYFTKTENGWRGVHQTELSKQVMDELYVGENVVTWRAFAGTEGVDTWQYAMLVNDASDDIAGVSFGTPPFFRGYIVFSGKKIG